MGKFDGWLICSDFDATAFDGPSGKMPEANVQAVKYFQENGGRFTFASGRYAKSFFDGSLHCPVRPNAPICTLNGAVISSEDGKEMLRSNVIAERERLIEFCFSFLDRYEAVKKLYFYSDCGSVQFKKDGEETREAFLGRIPEKLLKAVIWSETGSAEAVRDEVAREGAGWLYVTRSWKNGIDVQLLDSDKGRGVLEVKELCGADKLVTVGDYENDIPMLEAGDISYAVANAAEHVAAYADRRTVSAAEGALAAIIYEIEKEIDEK